MLFALPLFLQGVLGYTALETGVLVVFLAIGTFLISGGTPQLGRRLGGRAVVQFGLAAEIVAIAGVAYVRWPRVDGPRVIRADQRG